MFRALSLLLAVALTACSSSAASPGSPDAQSDATNDANDANDAPDTSSTVEAGTGGSCTCRDCVCASPGSPLCAQSHPSTDCLQGNCCVLAPDAGPLYFNEAGSCPSPGFCASPDDIGCLSWFRSNVCAGGDLCCVPSGLDAGGDR
jgi:hypothetical protein